MIATDKEGRITFLNPVAEELTGWSLDEAISKRLEEVFVIINEESRQTVNNPVEKVLQSGAVVGLANHTVLIRRDGREYPIDDSAAPIRDGEHLLGVVLVFHDVTESRRAERALQESEQRIRLALDASDIAVYSQDRDLRYTWLYQSNPAFTHMNIVGLTDYDVASPEDADNLTAIKRRAMEKQERVREELRITVEGQIWYYDLAAQPAYNAQGEVIGVIGTAVNVTERHGYEEALLQNKAEIEALNARLQRSMAETHHRVKNNLQIISALAEIQAGDGRPISAGALDRISMHVRALAGLHDLLTQSVRSEGEPTASQRPLRSINCSPCCRGCLANVRFALR